MILTLDEEPLVLRILMVLHKGSRAPPPKEEERHIPGCNPFSRVGYLYIGSKGDERNLL